MEMFKQKKKANRDSCRKNGSIKKIAEKYVEILNNTNVDIENVFKRSDWNPDLSECKN